MVSQLIDKRGNAVKNLYNQRTSLVMSYKNHAAIKDLTSGYVWLYSKDKEIAYYDGHNIVECKKKLTPLEKYYVQDFRQLIYDLY